MIGKLVVVVLLAGVLSGCAGGLPSNELEQRGADTGSQQSSGQGTQSGTGGQPQPSTTDVKYQVLRYIGIQADNWNTDPAKQNYSDLYTRIELFTPETTLGVGEANAVYRKYADETRSLFAKMLSGKSETVTTVANVSIRDPELTVAIPLFSMSRISGGKRSDSWTTSFTASNLDSPLFRISPNSSVTLKLNAKISSEVTSQGAAQAIGTIARAVQIAAPAAPLLTILSRQEVNNAAFAIDSVVSSLLSRDISEDLEMASLVSAWRPNSMLTLRSCVPFVRTESVATDQAPGGSVCGQDKDLDGSVNISVGTWKLRLACPRFSIFDQHNICNPIDDVPMTDGVMRLDIPANRNAIERRIADSVRDAQVLSFRLSSQVNIQAYALAQEWYTRFATARQRTSDDYARFCAGALDGMEQAGLNHLDAKLVLRALTRHSQHLAAFRADFATGKAGSECVEMLANVDHSR